MRCTGNKQVAVNRMRRRGHFTSFWSHCFQSNRGKQEIGSTEDADADKLIFTNLENNRWCTLASVAGLWKSGILGALLNVGGSASMSRLFHRGRQRGRYGVGFSESPPTLRCLNAGANMCTCHRLYIRVMDGRTPAAHFTFNSKDVTPIFRSARTSWNTFVRPFVRAKNMNHL